MVGKPAEIASDEFQSRKWDELTAGREFSESDIPDLMTLCSWYAVLDQCMREINAGGSTKVVYENEKGDLKPMPQIATMKQASAEIRALRKSLLSGARSNDVAQDGLPEPENPLEAIAEERRSMLHVTHSSRKTGT